MRVGREYIDELNKRYSNVSVEAVIQEFDKVHSEKIVFTTSFGLEDQVITDLICRNNLNVKLVTLDTGRLFEETYKTYRSTLERYGKIITAFFPPHGKVEELLEKKGPFSFYESIENRKECCYIRKVIPLGRAVEGMEVWITGLRAEQSENRAKLSHFEWDEGYRLVKYNPLLDWSFEKVREYIHEYNVPYNVLHDKGFASIGCSPCTRAIRPGEDFKAGRWWWEQNAGKECGIHTQK